MRILKTSDAHSALDVAPLYEARAIRTLGPFSRQDSLKHRLEPQPPEGQLWIYNTLRKGMATERPSGPLGMATQSTGRMIVDNGIQRPAPLSAVRRNPPTSVRHATSNSSLSTQVPISASQVVALAQEAMRNAIEENQSKAAEASGVTTELKPRVTIDLSHKQIQKFPEEVIDIIKTELER